ncbi:MAG: serine/threonine protein kinase [Clostridia bacterium]|nr:serine/threonine protein kinase [Clostridia bacterium]
MDGEREKPLQCQIDGIPYQAWEEPDLSWLKAYGTVFRVWDQRLTGNLCFGVAGPYGKLFVKYAGAKTVNFRGHPTDAIYTLHEAMPLYDRAHPALTRLLAHGPAGDGYAAIFEWRDALPLNGKLKYYSVLDQVRRLPPVHTLTMLENIIDLHASLALDGIIASDFHDGHVLIDFGKNEAIVCDINRYRRKPAFNGQGRMRGSDQFMAPEEYELNAALDETTTLYNMGALAFAFFGDNDDRSLKKWVGPKPLFEVASRATKKKKSDRYPSMRAFQDAWREAVGYCRL